VKAGRLRHRVTIQQRDTSSTWETEDSWTTYATVWGAIEPIRGREFWDASKVNSEVTARITIRYRSGITSMMRAVANSKTYGIVAVIPDERNAVQLQLMVKELN